MWRAALARSGGESESRVVSGCFSCAGWGAELDAATRRVLGVEGLAVEADSLAPAVLWPSSWSSVISSSFCLREDRLEELLEGAAVCSEHAAASWASLSSWAWVMSKVVSWGANLSVTAVEWTATRAVEACQRCVEVSREGWVGRALQQSRGSVGQISDQDLAAAVQQEAVQWRLVVVCVDGSAQLACAAGATGEQSDRVARLILEQEPGGMSVSLSF